MSRRPEALPLLAHAAIEDLPRDVVVPQMAQGVRHAVQPVVEAEPGPLLLSRRALQQPLFVRRVAARARCAAARW
ncbi:hypothetical protein [Streptomyces azureus]|uniref:Uncharacterized protein n=1 Tax=Streptomyces azureus TaxID=146537 RepID=A0A0K8PWR9_STRAJ|nr:hypothetical protein [Streptomyces azureus]GAP52173.1 uncharacterized protein SAZU_7047 [Streptomyces azureus]